jgi:hypothetical protein
MMNKKHPLNTMLGLCDVKMHRDEEAMHVSNEASGNAHN